MSQGGKRSKHNKKGSNIPPTPTTPTAASPPKPQTSRGRKSRARKDRSNAQSHTSSSMSSSTNHSTHSTHSIPKSRRHRNRHISLAAQTRSALLDSTYSRADRKYDSLEAHSPYDPFQSFFSTASCDEILSALVLALKSHPSTDVHVHPSGYRIRGRHFVDNACAEFQIEMLRTATSHSTHPNHILVEVQQRSGDGFVFQRLLHFLFTELHKTELIAASQYTLSTSNTLNPKITALCSRDVFDDEEKTPIVQHSNGNLSGNADVNVNVEMREMDDATLRMLLCALLDNGKSRETEMCRMASAWFARNLSAVMAMRILRAEPMFVGKVSELLLKCVDAETMQSVGGVVFRMLTESEGFRESAQRLNLKAVCERALRRWTEPIEKRFKGNGKYVIRVISSEEVAQRMAQCIEVLS